MGASSQTKKTSGQGQILTYALLIAAGIATPFLAPSYLNQVTQLWLFVVFALTWDLVGGQMGYNSFGNVLFLGLGMYVCAIIQVGLYYDVSEYTAAAGGGTHFTFNEMEFLSGLAIGLPAGAVVAALAAVLFGSLILGMRGQYFAICTLGLGIAAGQIAGGIDWIGAGSGMTTPEPPDSIGNVTVLFYWMSFVLAVLTIMALGWLLKTRFGLAINAIRDDEDKAEAMGLNTTAIKVTAWTISAFFLGMAGGIYGNLKKFIDPLDTAFSGETLGVWMVLMAILGGKGTLWGPVLGAIIFQFTKEFFWTYFLGWQRVTLGLLIVIIVVFFPQGIMGWARTRKAQNSSPDMAGQ